MKNKILFLSLVVVISLTVS